MSNKKNYIDSLSKADNGSKVAVDKFLKKKGDKPLSLEDAKKLNAVNYAATQKEKKAAITKLLNNNNE